MTLIPVSSDATPCMISSAFLRSVLAAVKSVVNPAFWETVGFRQRQRKLLTGGADLGSSRLSLSSSLILFVPCRFTGHGFEVESVREGRKRGN